MSTLKVKASELRIGDRIVNLAGDTIVVGYGELVRGGRTMRVRRVSDDVEVTAVFNGRMKYNVVRADSHNDGVHSSS